MEKEVKNENRLAKMEQKLDNLIDDVSEIKKDLKEHILQEDTKYAGKWVEKLTLGIIGGIIVRIVMIIFK